MNRRVLIILLCALVLSACASYLVYRAVGARATPGKAPPIAHLVVAARDLVAGTLIQDADLKMAAWIGPVPAGATVKRDAFLSRGVVSPIYDGEPVTENRLSTKGSGGGLAAMIPSGMRACAVRVNEVVGVAGFVVPGMRVDVLITGLPPGGNGLDGPKVRTLLQDIQVLSAGTNFQKDQACKPEQVQVVNLLVTPDQAEILSLASNETRIQLVLRNPMDTQISKPPGTMMSSLFGGASVPAPASPNRPQRAKPAERPPVPIVLAPVVPAVPSVYTIEVLNGAVHTQVKFSRPGAKP
jgi:pilus assembly protein CpaB